MFRNKGSGISFTHPLGQDESCPKNGLPRDRLEELVKKLRAGMISKAEYDELAKSYIHMALAIAGRYAAPSGRKLDDFVSCALFGIVKGLANARDRLVDNNLDAWIAASMHGVCRRFRTTDHVVCVPQTTNATRKALNKELIPFLATTLFSDSVEENEANHQFIKFEPVQEQDHTDDVKELIYLSASDDVDQEIINLRMEGYTDVEVAARLQISRSDVLRRRHVIENRYDRLNKET